MKILTRQDQLIISETPEAQNILRNINAPFSLEMDHHTGQVTPTRNPSGLPHSNTTVAVPEVPIEQLGDASFRKDYGVRCAFYAGAMANAISSTDMVIALGKAGLLGSFGAAGLPPSRLASSLDEIQAALPDGPYACNLIHSPFLLKTDSQHCPLPGCRVTQTARRQSRHRQ